MSRINENFNKLQSGYLFATMAKKIAAFSEQNPDKKVIKMSIGDATQALAPVVVDAIKKAADEMGTFEGFKGYGPDFGYDFLREAIAKNDFQARGVDISSDEIFVSDSAKCDTGNIQEIFSTDLTIAVLDPVYPTYVDTNVMAGRTGAYNKEKGNYDGIIYMPATAENGFKPALPKEVPNLIYLCYPNNPTGTTLSKQELKTWVDYAKKNGSLILFDAAYEAFIMDDDIPHSIYEIEGAKDVAIEFRSFSKTAGFTGTRCAYTVIPKGLTAKDASGNDVSLHGLWSRRISTKFNGVPYIIQRGAEACYSPEGKTQLSETINYYLNNAKILREGLIAAGLSCYGGVNAPYIWVKTPGDFGSWDFFDYLLEHAGVAGTPGVGFGNAGEGYFRLTAFGTLVSTEEAVSRISKLSF
ncbi:MAG: LL-diaminopimelate aminotransferase [Eubacteriales bacterium]